MTRTVVEQITQAGVQKLRFSGTAPGRYLTRAALAGAFIFVGALLSSLCAAWFYDTNLPLAKLLGGERQHRRGYGHGEHAQVRL